MKQHLCVIGYGGMGGWHTRAALTSDAVELKGIYDIKEQRNQAAEQAGIHAYRSLEEVLSDPEIDLITVATPNDVHKQLVIAGLNAGKNVISEKPVAMSSAELEEMIAAAHKSGKLFTVHQNRRWDVDYLVMKQLSQTGEIGKIFNLESRIHGSRGIPSDWRGVKKYGGGMMLDWGVHLIDQALLVMSGKISEVFCRFDHITNEEVDDGFQMHLFFEDGARAYIEVGTYNFISLPRFYAQGDKGSAIITDWREKCRVVKCKAWHENDVLPIQTAAGLTKTMAPRDEITTDTYEIERPASDVHDFYRNVCRAIEGKEQQLVTHEQMMRVMKVMEAGFESDRLGQVVRFAEGL